MLLLLCFCGSINFPLLSRTMSISVSYLIGVPILGYSLDIGKEHVNLIDERLEKLIYSGQLDSKELDRYRLQKNLFFNQLITPSVSVYAAPFDFAQSLSKTGRLLNLVVYTKP